MKKIIFTSICLFLIAATAKTNAQNEAQYKLSDKIKIAGNDHWDYLAADTLTGRIFISHGNEVQVLDEKSKKIIGTIPDTKGVHGIAIAYDLNKGFISDGKDSAVTVFDLTSLKTITKVPVTGQNPDCILYDTFTQRVFAFNGRTSNCTIIDAKTNKVIGTLFLEGKPEFAVSDGQGKIFVNLENRNMICQINAQTFMGEKTFSIAPGESPSGLAIDVKNHILFSGCDNKKMIIVNAQTGQVITTLPIGEGVDAVAFDPVLKRAYSSNGDGTLTVVQEENPKSFKVIANVATQKGARTLALDSKTQHIYLSTAEFGAPTEVANGQKRKRPSIVENSFVLLQIDVLTK